MPQDDLSKPSSSDNVTGDEGPRIATEENEHLYERILVPIDFSEHSKTTVSYATRIATRYNATLYLLHVFKIPDYVVTPYTRRRQNSAEVHSQVDAAEQDAREHLESFAKELSTKGIKVEAYLRVGYPFDEIVLMANHFHVDLIVIGSHGHGRIARLLVGSTAQRVVEHARCPVLVVKGPGPEARVE
jgi:nucleotide-binding universal stress UspA family protein